MWITPPRSPPTENQPRVTHNPMGAPEAPPAPFYRPLYYQCHYFTPRAKRKSSLGKPPFTVRYIITDFFYSCEHSTARAFLLPFGTLCPCRQSPMRAALLEIGAMPCLRKSCSPSRRQQRLPALFSKYGVNSNRTRKRTTKGENNKGRSKPAL